MNKTVLYVLAALIVTPGYGLADEGAGWDYGSNGWQWSKPETGSFVWVGLRAQSRFNDRLSAPLTSNDLREDGEEGIRVNRARYKIGGGVGRQLTYYHEYDLRNGQLLDLRATWKPIKWLNLRVGQWKAEYNRERVDSSGKQQFVDRSIANYWFTVDRQNGVMASGRAAVNGAADSSWWLGVLNGGGMNEAGDGGRPMLVGRYQWNFTRTELPFSQSALKRYDEPHGFLSFGAVSNDSAHTRFSSNGGGNLPGYTTGADNQYRVRQYMQEFGWQLGGWSVQQEFHVKEIEDRTNGGSNRVRGGYVQAGWFPSERLKWWPKPLEIAIRGAVVDPDFDFVAASHYNKEFSLASNWFFNGHRNKLTVDVSRLEIEDVDGSASDWRVRLQWDLSL